MEVTPRLPGGDPLHISPRRLLPILFFTSVTIPVLHPPILLSGLVDAAGPTTPAAVSPTPGAPVSGSVSGSTASVATATLSTTPVGSAPATPGLKPIPEPTPPRHYVVLIVIDGSQPSYVTLTKLPHIGALMQRGVVYDQAWDGEMESVTPDMHVTFGTGTLPRENGFLGFGWATPQTRKAVDFRTLLADHQIDPVLNALPVPSVATRLHQLIPGAISVAASGHKDYAVVGLGGGTATYELYGKFIPHQFIPAFLHAPPPLTAAQMRSLSLRQPLKLGGEDRWAFRYAAMTAARVRPRLLMMNLPEMDTWGHWYGPRDTKIFRFLMKNIDRGIGKLEATYRKLGILNQTDFIITADHGMMESRPAHDAPQIQSLAKAVQARIVRNDGEGGSIWLQDPTQARTVAERLVSARLPHIEAIFYRSNPGLDYHYVLASPVSWLANAHVATALQSLVDTTAGQNGPDVWTLYRENFTIVPRNVAGTWKGTHGGSTWKVQHIPLIISGPGIRQGVRSSFPARAIDIAPTMERLLGLPSIHRDGVILGDALTQPAQAELKPEQALTAPLTADVRGLQLQSKLDSHYISHWPTIPPPLTGCTFAPAPAIPPQRSCSITPYTATNQ